MDEIAPMLVAMTLILTIGGVVLLRPLARRLGDLLELMVKQRRGELDNPVVERTEHLLESLSSRLSLVEERLDFTDRLLQERGDDRLLHGREPERPRTPSKEADA